MTEKKRNLNGRTLALLALILVALLAILWFALGRDWLDSRHAGETDQRTRQLYYGQASALPRFSLFASAAAEAAPEGSYGTAPDAPAAADVPKDSFLSLYAQNTDVVGWLKAGENIDAPVVQRDNSFYMDHNFFGEKDRNGTLFVNANNELDPRDDVILIHGHNMKSGDMFGKLLSFRKEDYMRQHPLVHFEQVYGNEEPNYVPIAAFDASMLPNNKTYFDITQILFEDDGQPGPDGRKSSAFQAYLDAIQARSYWASPVDVNVNDHLLMLITCSYEQEDGRFVLVCRELREGESPEAVEQSIKGAEM